MIKRSEQALDYYYDGFNCAQSVIVPFIDILNITEEVALRMTSGFGGGMGRMQETCGAVTGAFMVIGYLRGKYKDGEDEAKELTNNLIQEFSRRFAEEKGSINCKALINFDLNSEQGREAADKADVFHKKCSGYITLAVDLLEEVLSI